MPGVPPPVGTHPETDAGTHAGTLAGDSRNPRPVSGKVVSTKPVAIKPAFAKPAVAKPAVAKPAFVKLANASSSFPRAASGKSPPARPDIGSRPSGIVFKPLADMVDDRFALLVIDGGRQEVFGIYDAVDIVAQWQALGKATGLALLLPRGNGYEQLYDSVGAVRLGGIINRRRHALLAGRRPRFLVRRKTTRLSAQPVVWR